MQKETSLGIPGHIALKNVLVWFQDEARFGQRNTPTKIWAEKGTIMDGASWHQLYLADKYDNLTIMHLPPY